MKSNDGGDTFGDPVNLSNNPGFSEHPQIAAVGDNIYIAWVDDSSGERKVMFCKSPDSGKTFSENIVVAQNTIGPHHAELAAKGENVYIVWMELTQKLTIRYYLVKVTMRVNLSEN